MKHATLKDSISNKSVPLQSVSVNGELIGMVLKIQIEQHYINTSQNELEVIYTFPLAWGSVLTSMRVQLNEKTLTGRVFERQVAEEKYENSIANGDTPIMVVQEGKDIYSARLGNLKPNDEVKIILEYAQVLRQKQGTLRISIPTTIAPRFGDSVGLLGMAANLLSPINPFIEHKFNLRLEIPNQFGAKKIKSPSHKIDIVQEEALQLIEFSQAATLDRDFVLLIEELPDQIYLVQSEDALVPDSTILLSSFIPRLDLPNSHGIKLKILVDCSGSMAGDRIVQAKNALRELAYQLDGNDQISFTKFGTHAANFIGTLKHCDEKLLDLFSDEIERVEADYGGTELESALNRVLEIREEDGKAPEACAVLIITDGDIWGIDPLLSMARECNHQIYSIGLGSSPAESLLQSLSETTGGACELVTPNEDISYSVTNLLQRIRNTEIADISLEINNSAPIKCKSRSAIFSGDMTNIWARIPHQSIQNITIKIFKDDDLLQEIPLNLENLKTEQGDLLARVAASQRLLGISDSKEATELALKYQLVTQHTNLFLVHVRDKNDKAEGMPDLLQIENMLASGWGGFGVTNARYISTQTPSNSTSSFALPSVFRMRERTGYTSDDLSRKYISFSQAVHYLSEEDNPLVQLMKKYIEYGSETLDFWISVQRIETRLKKLIDIEIIPKLLKFCSTTEHSWALVIYWLSLRMPNLKPADYIALELAREFCDRHSVKLNKRGLNLIDELAQEKFHLLEDFNPAEYEIPLFLRKKSD